MPLKITAATRTGGTGCQHYNMTVTDTGYEQTVLVHLDELMELIEKFHPEPEKRKAVFAALWAAYRIKVSGATPASCLNVVIA